MVDPFLGPGARRYLVAWDDFNKTKTEGLTRKQKCPLSTQTGHSNRFGNLGLTGPRVIAGAGSRHPLATRPYD